VKAIYLEYYGDKNGNKVPDLEEIGVKELKSDGDFRSLECVELLKQADIVVTNPPFSLFREYVAQLMQYNKKFVIVGPRNAITYKEIFKHIRDNELWIGYGFANGNAFFKTPNFKDFAKGVYDEEKGLVKFRNVVWYTNLDLAKRHEEIILYKKYTPEEFPTYDNYNAINVDKVANIPMDWGGGNGCSYYFFG